jgi:hypothetical protein
MSKLNLLEKYGQLFGVSEVIGWDEDPIAHRFLLDPSDPEQTPENTLEAVDFLLREYPGASGETDFMHIPLLNALIIMHGNERGESTNGKGLLRLLNGRPTLGRLRAKIGSRVTNCKVPMAEDLLKRWLQGGGVLHAEIKDWMSQEPQALRMLLSLLDNAEYASIKHAISCFNTDVLMQVPANHAVGLLTNQMSAKYVLMQLKDLELYGARPQTDVALHVDFNNLSWAVYQAVRAAGYRIRGYTIGPDKFELAYVLGVTPITNDYRAALKFKEKQNRAG